MRPTALPAAPVLIALRGPSPVMDRAGAGPPLAFRRMGAGEPEMGVK
jgi:hypothetical protein